MRLPPFGEAGGGFSFHHYILLLMSNSDNLSIPFDAITDYLTGAATQQELDEIDAWRALSADNEAYFAQMKEIWFSIVAERRADFDPQLAFEEFKVNVQRLVSCRAVVSGSSSSSHRLVRIAAAVVGAMVVGAAAWFVGYTARSEADGRIVVRAPQGSQTVVVLPDSSEVHLNAGSQLVYGQGYGIGNRRVALEGEAFFNVRHNDDLPFIVRSKDFDVHVTGTKFDFRNYFNDDEAAITLFRGSVAIDDPAEHRRLATLTPGRRFVYDKKTCAWHVSGVDTTRVGRWTRGQIFFDEKLLTDIAKDLERSHNVNVVIANDSLRTRRFYGSFDVTDNVTEIVRSLAMSGGIHYRVKGRDIILY